MTRFTDGPAAGMTLYLQRAPIYLRVTVFGDIFDALDLLGDRPDATEDLYAYRLSGPVGTCHVQKLDKRGRRCGGWYTTAAYRLIEPQPGDEVMRDGERWREWTRAEYAADRERLEAQIEGV